MSEFCTAGELRTITGTSDRDRQVKYLSEKYHIHPARHGSRVVVYRDVMKAAMLGRGHTEDGVEMNLEALDG